MIVPERFRPLPVPNPVEVCEIGRHEAAGELALCLGAACKADLLRAFIEYDPAEWHIVETHCVRRDRKLVCFVPRVRW